MEMFGNLGDTAGVTPTSSASATPSGHWLRSTAPTPQRRRAWRTPICGALSIR
jgi:hypothetical protein